MALQITVMAYQLVLQFPFTSPSDYDKLIELENAITSQIGGLGKVDGHDAGASEMNIFIYTDDPIAAFERACVASVPEEMLANMKAAFRDRGAEEFTVIYPNGLTRFKIL